MKIFPSSIFFSALFILSIASPAQTNKKPDIKSRTGFTENKGQIVDQDYHPNPAVKYLLCRPGFNVQLRQTGFSYDTYSDEKNKNVIESVNEKGAVNENFIRHYHRVDIELLNCNPDAEIIPLDKSTSYFNYFTTGTPQGGVSGVHDYSRVLYRNIYPDIDLEFFSSADQTGAMKNSAGVKYNFIVHPGGNVGDIRLVYKGADKTSLQDGKILVNVNSGIFSENIPESFLEKNKEKIDVHYVSSENNVFSFQVVNEHSFTSDLIIDPTPCLLWSTYYGSGAIDQATGITLDGSNNVYICGLTSSTNNIATAGAWQTTQGGVAGTNDVFVAEFNSTGTLLLWGTFYGGTADESARDIALDASGNICIMGSTASPNNIATVGAWQTVFSGNNDVFIAKFNPTGTSLLWGTYYGAAGYDDGFGLALDASNNIYITGSTENSTGISTAGTWQTTFGGFYDAFVAKFNSTGTTLLWGTYYGGASVDKGYDIALDASNNVYVTGYAISPGNISTAGAWQTTFAGNEDAFVAKFNSSGTSLLWGSYYGGTGLDEGNVIALDASNNVYITGITYSTSGIATAGAYQTVFAGGLYDAFVAKFNSTGSSLTWGTYYGGSVRDEGLGLCLDGSGDVFISGRTSSTTSIATAGAWQTTFAGGAFDAFLAMFNSSGSSLVWGTYYGGTFADYGEHMILDANNNLHLTGYTLSSNAISTAGSWHTASGGSYDAFVAEFGCTGATAVLSTTATQTNISCNAQCNGTATVSPSGGASPYTYSWSNSQTTSTATNLCAGNYTCTVTDNVGATVTATFLVTQAPAITITPAQTNVVCNGNTNGSATVIVNGGTPAYTYSWSSGGTNATENNLAAGNFTCTITDSAGCIQTQSFTITAPPAIMITPSQTNIVCNGNTNGSATVNVSGGTPGYTYSWTSGGTNATENNLAAGNYTCTITDSAGCIKTQSFTITAPPAIIITASQTDILCNGNINGSATVNVSGGTPGYTYSWSSGGVNATENNLAAGNYTCTITDSAGCTQTQTFSITQPPAITIIPSHTDITCNGNNNGIATVNVSGGTPGYTYSWSSGGVNATENNLAPGTYTCTVTDANACVQTQTFSISEPSVLTLSANSMPQCGANNGIATTAVSGGTGAYTYNWSPAGGNGASASGLSSGNYTCTVTDINGCTITQTVNVIANPSPTAAVSPDTTINIGMSVALTAAGGTVFNWSPSSGLSCTNCQNPVANPTQTTMYCVVVTDTNSCSDTACMIVNVTFDCGELFIPNAFSPNGDNENDQLCIYGKQCISTIEFVIYDRWGEKVFETNDPNNCWDGTFQGKPMNSAVFAYYLNATMVNGQQVIRKGNIALVR